MPYRGKRNEPGYTLAVVETIAVKRGLAWEEVLSNNTNAIAIPYGRKRLVKESTVIVVEGREDDKMLGEKSIRYRTNGSAIDEEKHYGSKQALQTREVIVFLRP